MSNILNVLFSKEIIISIIVIAIVTILWRRKASVKKRKALEKQLQQALSTVRDLEDKLNHLEVQRNLNELSNKNNNVNNNSTNSNREIRIWMDGAFDMMHYGHMNAFRQGRALGTYLIVGVNSDETITACKGKPVCAERERVETVRGCKWVDEVVEGVPYVMNDEYLTYIIDKYSIDYVVHGDDPCIVDGKDVYESAVKMGKYLTIPRTEGISTTDIVGRMLLMTRSHHSYVNSSSSKQRRNVSSRSNSRSSSFDETRRAIAAVVGGSSKDKAPDDHDSDRSSDDDEAGDYKLASGRKSAVTDGGASDVSGANSSGKLEIAATEDRVVAVESASLYKPFVRKSRFLTTSHVLRLFGSGVQAPKPGDKVVYIAGAWDMLHAGHIEILKQARDCGDYLIVGVYNDTIVNQQRGLNFPILNLHERVLSVLGCKYANDVLIDAPLDINQELILTLKIDVVVRGSYLKTPSNLSGNSWDNAAADNAISKESKQFSATETKTFTRDFGTYELPRKMGILKEVHCSMGMSVLDMVERIQEQRERFAEKYKKKASAEDQYYKDKYNL